MSELLNKFYGEMKVEDISPFDGCERAVLRMYDEFVGDEISTLTARIAELEGALDTAKESVMEIIQQALSGETERYILDDGHRKYTRWGLVEEDIRETLEIAKGVLKQ